MVGYRLYRTDDGVKFQYTGKAALVGDPTVITDDRSVGLTTAYYVTAVDVAGKESAPSAIVGVLGGGDPTGSASPAGGDSTPETLGETPGSSDDNGNNGQHPASPANVSVMKNDHGFTVSWDANSALELVTSYNVYVSDAQGGTYTKAGSTSDSHFSFNTDSSNVWIQVTAVNVLGESPPSAPVQYSK